MHDRGVRRPRRCSSSATSSITRRWDRCAFTRQGFVRPLYFTILITHVTLAALVLPLAIVTLSRGLKARYRPASRDRPLDASDLALRVGDRRARLRPALSADLAALIQLYWPSPAFSVAGRGSTCVSAHLCASRSGSSSRWSSRAAQLRKRVSSAWSTTTRASRQGRDDPAPTSRHPARHLHRDHRRQGPVRHHRLAPAGGDSSRKLLDSGSAAPRRTCLRRMNSQNRRSPSPFVAPARWREPSDRCRGQGSAGRARAADALFTQQKWDDAIGIYATSFPGRHRSASSTCRSPPRTGTKRITTRRSPRTTSCSKPTRQAARAHWHRPRKHGARATRRRPRRLWTQAAADAGTAGRDVFYQPRPSSRSRRTRPTKRPELYQKAAAADPSWGKPLFKLGTDRDEQGRQGRRR